MLIYRRLVLPNVYKPKQICLYSTQTNNSTTKLNEENSQPGNILDKSKAKLFELMSIYEEAIGLKEIKDAQQTVLEVSYQTIFILTKFCFKFFFKRLKKISLTHKS